VIPNDTWALAACAGANNRVSIASTLKRFFIRTDYAIARPLSRALESALNRALDWSINEGLSSIRPLLRSAEDDVPKVERVRAILETLPYLFGLPRAAAMYMDLDTLAKSRWSLPR
jgi:hypothetical protein